MCRFATINPRSNETVVAPFINVTPGVPSIFPLSLTGALIPKIRVSVIDTSTCASLRSGPKITTFWNSPFGPATVIRSLHTY